VLARANADCPVVALDGAGGAIAAWREATEFGAPSEAWITVARLRPDTGWATPETFSVPASRSGCPAIASAPPGLAVVVWSNTGTSPGLWARPLGAAAGTAARKIQDLDPAHEITSLRLARDGGGNGYAAWIRARTDTSVTGTYSVRPPSGTVWARRFVDGGTRWDPPEALQGPSSSPSDLAAVVDVAVHTDGRAVAFWFESANAQFTPWAAQAAAAR
jgi:hypothetical protein